MLKSKQTHTKTGNTTWDYFLDPTTLPTDHPVYTAWNTYEPKIYGADSHAMFPGVKFTFEVVSPQELILWKEFDSIDTVMAWMDYCRSWDLHPATTLDDLMNLIYPGEDLQVKIQLLEGFPENKHEDPTYIELVEQGIIQE
jgi:hypothetical protein